MKATLVPAAAALLAAAAPLHAQTGAAPPPAEKISTVSPNELAARIFVELQTKTPESTVEALVSSSPLINLGETDKKANANRLRTLIDLYGPVSGRELVRTRRVGERLLEQTYLVHMERYAMRFTFVFYRAEQGWTISSYSFDDEIEGLLDK